jgi:hypothetical protein
MTRRGTEGEEEHEEKRRPETGREMIARTSFKIITESRVVSSYVSDGLWSVSFCALLSTHTALAERGPPSRWSVGFASPFVSVERRTEWSDGWSLVKWLPYPRCCCCLCFWVRVWFETGNWNWEWLYRCVCVCKCRTANRYLLSFGRLEEAIGLTVFVGNG